MRIKYSKLARNNLMDIRQHYLDTGGRSLAIHMVRSIRAGIAALADNPHIAPPYEMASGLRRLVTAKGAFLVFYRVRESVDVLHIRRAEREPLDADHLDGAL